MKILMTRRFQRWRKHEKIGDALLQRAITEMNQGLYDANLGGNVYKKRIGRPGQGKSGGSRSLVAFKSRNMAFFVYGFNKNQRSNISHLELAALKKLADELFSYKSGQLDLALASGTLIEIESNE